MAFMAVNNLGTAEYAVKFAIPKLQGEKERISYADIADEIGCSERTVQRAVKSLMAAGKLERADGSKRGGGYRYLVRQ